MSTLHEFFSANRRWAARMLADDPCYFSRLAETQRPRMLWIGCSDARLPPNLLLDRPPGDIFVHRNVANVVVHTDVNCLSVLQYAVDVLQVEHVVVAGHYGCGGVVAALQSRRLGLIDNWLRHIRDVYTWHREEVDMVGDPGKRVDLLCQLNVRASVANVCHSNVVQDAWRRGQKLAVHGWIISIQDGLLHDLDLSVEHPEQIPPVYRVAP